VHQRVFLRQAICCSLYGGLAPLGWVWVGLGHGSTSSPGSGDWVGLGQLFGGLGWVWVDEMDPRTTLRETAAWSNRKRRFSVLSDQGFFSVQLCTDCAVVKNFVQL